MVDAEEYALKKRLVTPVQFDSNDVGKKYEPNLKEETLVDFINISSSTEEDSRDEIQEEASLTETESNASHNENVVDELEIEVSCEQSEHEDVSDTETIWNLSGDTVDEYESESDDEQPTRAIEVRREQTENESVDDAENIGDVTCNSKIAPTDSTNSNDRPNSGADTRENKDDLSSGDGSGDSPLEQKSSHEVMVNQSEIESNDEELTRDTEVRREQTEDESVADAENTEDVVVDTVKQPGIEPGNKQSASNENDNQSATPKIRKSNRGRSDGNQNLVLLSWLPKRVTYTRNRNIFSSVASTDRSNASTATKTSEQAGSSSTLVVSDTASMSSDQSQRSVTAYVNVDHIKKENEELRVTINNLNLRLGDEVVTDDDDDAEDVLSDGEKEPHDNVVNTRYFQTDSQFATDHDYITNVCLLII